MDGLLVVDKPVGPTSHDVVARVRRALGERRVGHTGTLDPAASGILPLVLGRATRLARFLSSSDKDYEAVVRLGVATDTYDKEGVPVGPPYQGPLPSREAVESALAAFRGAFMQRPPAYSAKKIGGQRSYRLARIAAGARHVPGTCQVGARHVPGTGTPVEVKTPEPSLVSASAIEIIATSGDTVTLSVTCSAGFYVRSLAHDLGARLGIGAHLAGLRRTRCAEFTAGDAVSLDDLDRDPSAARARVVPLAAMLPGLPAVVLTDEGVQFLAHGRAIGPAQMIERREGAGPSVRLIGGGGELLGVAEPAATPGFLHPAVVLM